MPALGILATAACASLLLAGCGGSGNSTTQTVQTPTKFTTFDGPGGSPTTNNGINNIGTVVGFTTSNNVNANFLRSATGGFVSVNLTGGAGGDMANGVNTHNAVVGVSSGNAFLLVNGSHSGLGIPGAISSVAFGINDNGVIVGQYVNAAGNTPGFVDANGVITTINATPTATVTNVQGINNGGIAIGFYSADGVHQHGFLYNTSTKQTTLLPDPSTARITANGLVLTQFLGINDNNEAVGYYQTTNGSQYGFLFNLSTNTYTFLDAPNAAVVNGVQITQITGVSNAGEICGFYIAANGAQHGFIATN